MDEIIEARLAYFKSRSTHDNYWGDWVPNLERDRDAFKAAYATILEISVPPRTSTSSRRTANFEDQISRPLPPVDSHDLPVIPGDEDEEQLLAILTFTGDPQYLEPDPIYDTDSSDESDSDDSLTSVGPTPDNGLSCEHPWATDPCPSYAVWEENRSGNCPKAFWRSYQPPPSFTDPMPDPAQASWGPDFDDSPPRRLSANTRRYRRTIESQLNPEEQLQLSRSRRTELVPAEILYSTGMNPAQHRVYQHYSEEDILCVGDQQVDLPLITEQSHQRLIQEGYGHIHIGMVMVRLYAQHRRDAGVNALVTLRDTRWGGDRQIIATMEVDLTHGTQMVYVVPDIMMTVNDFANCVEISVQTHGYDDWQGGESNLLISRMVIGRLTNTSNTNFAYNVQNVADYLASNGVLALPGTKYSTAELQGRRWILKPSQRRNPHNPTRVETHSLLNGGVSMSFRGYTPVAPRPPPPVDAHDMPILPDDQDEEQLLAILTFTGDPQYLEPDPIYDTESSDDSFYDSDSDQSDSSDGPTPDNGQLLDHPWASDPCPAYAVWEENRSGNCPEAFWRSYQPPPSFTAPMPDPALASWGPDFDEPSVPPEDYLASHGVLALPGTKYTTEELQGRRWILRPSSRRDPHNPTQVETRSLLDGGVSLAFRGYRPSSSRPPPPVDSNDLPILPGDEDEEQLLAILTFTGDPQYLEPDPIYDTGTESSDDSFYAGSNSEPDSEVSDGPTPDSGLLADHPWANDPKPAHAI
ncbi:hypothetical protein FEM48_Zijuj12G0141700 [Ziziphus jujuba var. spinosa]|uniref:Polyprotein n=1 Tax=Ziziphus jujuba var. spinosa TaxID=714518 RepID=A0A978UDS9_ZIZJJ|nr:hypothetical protein FEM48_Zijuj12G0141700 [Ziziphus jujuba var. spinosa]